MIDVCQDRLHYARAPATLEQQRGSVRERNVPAGALLRRIRRIVGQPTEPHCQRRTWVNLVVVLALLALLPAGMIQGNQPAGKTESVQDTQNDNGLKRSGKTTISGRIVLGDGSPATTKSWLYSVSRRKKGKNESTSMGSEGQYTDQFSVEVRSGTVWLRYFSDKFAPAWVGPLDLKPGQKLRDVTLVLQSGFSKLVRVGNEKGEPVAGATLVAHPVINGSTLGPVFEKTTDENGEYLLTHLGEYLLTHLGEYLLTHLADAPYQLNIRAPGYEPIRAKLFSFKADEPATFTMVRSQPVVGIVTNARGISASFAKVFLSHTIVREDSNYGFEQSGPRPCGELVATVDEQGRYQLRQLARNSHHVFIVETIDKARLVVYDIKPENQETQIMVTPHTEPIIDVSQLRKLPRIVVPPRQDLHVKILGDLSPLRKFRGSPSVRVRQRIEFNSEPRREHSFLIRENIPIELTKEGGIAKYRGLPFDPNAERGKQQVHVSLNGNLFSKPVDINPDGVTEVVFQLAEPTDPANPATRRPTPPRRRKHQLMIRRVDRLRMRFGGSTKGPRRTGSESRNHH